MSDVPDLSGIVWDHEKPPCTYVAFVPGSNRTITAIECLESAALRCQYAGMSREEVTDLMQQVVDFRREAPPEPYRSAPNGMLLVSDFHPRDLTPEENGRWADWHANMKRRGYFAEPNTDTSGHT